MAGSYLSLLPDEDNEVHGEHQKDQQDGEVARDERVRGCNNAPVCELYKRVCVCVCVCDNFYIHVVLHSMSLYETRRDKGKNNITQYDMMCYSEEKYIPSRPIG